MNFYLLKIKFLTIISEKNHNILMKFNSKIDNYTFKKTSKNLLRQIKLILLISSFHNIYATEINIGSTLL